MDFQSVWYSSHLAKSNCSTEWQIWFASKSKIRNSECLARSLWSIPKHVWLKTFPSSWILILKEKLSWKGREKFSSLFWSTLTTMDMSLYRSMSPSLYSWLSFVSTELEALIHPRLSAIFSTIPNHRNRLESIRGMFTLLKPQVCSVPYVLIKQQYRTHCKARMVLSICKPIITLKWACCIIYFRLSSISGHTRPFILLSVTRR